MNGRERFHATGKRRTTAGAVPLCLRPHTQAWRSCIVSINRYRAEMVEAFEPLYRVVNKPIQIGEFHPDNDSCRYVHVCRKGK